MRSYRKSAPRTTSRVGLQAAILTAILVGPGATSVRAQNPITGGYYEHTFQTVTWGSETDILDASKLRLDLSSGLGSAFQFTGNLNALAYHGRVEQDLRPYFPDAVVADLQAAGVPLTRVLPESRIWLDNAFLTWNADALRVRAGKQQLSWGPGYSYNPTDLFHRKDALDPTYEKEGVGALRVDWRWGIGGQLTAIAAPDGRFETSGYAVRTATHVSALGYDVALTAHQVQDTVALDATLAPVAQRRRAIGLEFSGPLLGLGVWLEGNHNWMAVEPDFTRLVAGVDYTFADGTYVLVETLFNGRGPARAPYPTQNWVGSLMAGEPVGRWWSLAGVRRELTALTSGELYFFASPDGSFAVNPRVQASVAQNADLVVFAGFTFGDDDGAFPPGTALLVARGTVYF